MWQAGRKIKLSACLLGLVSSLCWGEPAFVCFTAVEVKQIQQELESMRLSLNVLRQSQERSSRESMMLSKECKELEKTLQLALMELETSSDQLIQSSQKSAELETLFQTLRLEYEGLKKSYKRLSREKSLWKGATATLAVTTVVMGLWIALSR